MEQNQAPQAAAPLTPEQQATADTLRGKLTKIFTNAVALFPGIKSSCDKAVIALSGIKEITTPEQDQYAMNLLIKVRTTYEEKSAQRKSVTAEMDELKSWLMEPEKTIDIDSKANSEYSRVKKLRDGWATAEKLKADKAKAGAKLVQDKTNEKARITAELGRTVIAGMTTAVTAVANWVSQTWGALTLANIDEFATKLGTNPVLKPENYATWFAVQYNELLVTPAEYAELVAAAKVLYPYDVKNIEFGTQAGNILKTWAAQIETKRAELKAVADLATTNAAAAEQLAQAQANQTAELAQQQTQAIQQEATAQVHQVDLQEQNAQMGAAFTAQVTVQSVEDQSGTKVIKVGTLSCPEEEVVVVISQMLYHIVTHPKYKGLIKRDTKTKQLKHDENGRPIYQEWLEEMLGFFANNCDTSLVPGISITEKVSTIQKEQK